MTDDKQSLVLLEESIARAIDVYMEENPSASWEEVLQAIERVLHAIRRSQTGHHRRVDS